MSLAPGQRIERPGYATRAHHVASRFNVTAFASDARSTLSRWHWTAVRLAYEVDQTPELVRRHLRGERADFGVVLAIADTLDLPLDKYRRQDGNPEMRRFSGTSSNHLPRDGQNLTGISEI